MPDLQIKKKKGLLHVGEMSGPFFFAFYSKFKVFGLVAETVFFTNGGDDGPRQ